MSDEKKRPRKVPDPKSLVQWWHEANEQIRLARPHETSDIREKLILKYIKSRIKKSLDSNQIEEPHPSEKLIAEWYHNELLKIRETYPDRPLKEREREAASIVIEKIKQYRKIIRLDKFF